MKSVKRKIKKQRHIAQFLTAILSMVVIKILSTIFKNVAVAILPFKPYSFVKNFATFQLETNESMNENTSLIGAPFLFVLIFVTFKLIIRKGFFINNVRLITQSSYGLSLPRTMFMR